MRLGIALLLLALPLAGCAGGAEAPDGADPPAPPVTPLGNLTVMPVEYVCQDSGGVCGETFADSWSPAGAATRPQVVQGPDGDLLAVAWRHQTRGAEEADVSEPVYEYEMVRVSRDGGASWTDPLYGPERQGGLVDQAGSIHPAADAVYTWHEGRLHAFLAERGYGLQANGGVREGSDWWFYSVDDAGVAWAPMMRLPLPPRAVDVVPHILDDGRLAVLYSQSRGFGGVLSLLVQDPQVPGGWGVHTWEGHLPDGERAYDCRDGAFLPGPGLRFECIPKYYPGILSAWGTASFSLHNGTLRLDQGWHHPHHCPESQMVGDRFLVQAGCQTATVKVLGPNATVTAEAPLSDAIGSDARAFHVQQLRDGPGGGLHLVVTANEAVNAGYARLVDAKTWHLVLHPDSLATVSLVEIGDRLEARTAYRPPPDPLPQLAFLEDGGALVHASGGTVEWARFAFVADP